MAKQSTQNDTAWEALFEKYDILDNIAKNGKYIISAEQIKEYREPRLMAKFDHSINLPHIFSANSLAILPISRGSYVLSHFEAYKSFKTQKENATKVSLPNHIQSLNPNKVTSEAIALNCALAAGMLEDFLEEESLVSTVSGRMGSGTFDFKINNTRLMSASLVQVDGSQIEIDAAVEGIHCLALLEAKRDLSEDFLIRQLYYPYRVWETQVTKTVRPVFLIYSNGIYRFYEYAFQDLTHYNSLELVRYKSYTIEDTAIKESELLDLIAQVNPLAQEPSISFPQADNFERVINICELLQSKTLSRDEVTEKYAFDARQTNYYTDAARYLGLTEKARDPLDSNKVKYRLSARGAKIMALPYKQRQLALCACILEHKVFFEVFVRATNNTMPDKNTIIQLMMQANIYKVEAEATYERRASTISGWIHWMLQLI